MRCPLKVFLKRMGGNNAKEVNYLPRLRQYLAEVDGMPKPQIDPKIEEWRSNGISWEEAERIAEIFPIWNKQRTRLQNQSKGKKSGEKRGKKTQQAKRPKRKSAQKK